MALPRAFLSFDFDHDLVPNTLLLVRPERIPPTPFAVQDWSSRRHFPRLSGNASSEPR